MTGLRSDLVFAMPFSNVLHLGFPDKIEATRLACRRQAEHRQVTPHSLESFAVLQTDPKVWGDRLTDRHRGRLASRLKRECGPIKGESWIPYRS
jgi:hypothetical protein